ncbi:MAG TPA: DNA-3-methyladenine glycosylase [Woeseiaceae bacterium]|nr:DNA-3-methyladenine glycosylase [Woeseiaceae bacterium]
MVRKSLPLKLTRSFYLRDDVVQISRELLGKVLCSKINGAVTKALITETEAYAGVGDRASHAFRGRRTKRTEPMFADGGTAYVYLCYGIHHLFNVVTAEAGTPHAILIRAGQPLEGISLMQRRRGKRTVDKSLLAGPGSLAKALGITTRASGESLLGGKIWIEDHGIVVDPTLVREGPRVGVDYAGDDALRPYRFESTAFSSSGS